FSVAAFSSSARWPSRLKSLLSSSKNTGFSGELRFKSSRDAEEIASVGTGSAGTRIGSSTGCGGAGGLPPGSPVFVVGGGGVGRATGGFFFPHAAVVSTHATATAISVRFIVAVLSVLTFRSLLRATAPNRAARCFPYA